VLRQGRNDPRKLDFFSLDQSIESVLSLPKATGIDKRQSQPKRNQSPQETVSEVNILAAQQPSDQTN
jgi:hypothetical protein